MSSIIRGDDNFDSADVPTATEIATAWVNFDGSGTVSIRDQLNVSSITDNGTGNYTVNFSTALADANYSATFTSRRAATNDDSLCRIARTGTYSTAGVQVLTSTGGNTAVDSSIVNCVVFGG